MGAKITKLPDDLDPFLITCRKIKEKYMVCPFCGETRPVEWMTELDYGVSCFLSWTVRYKRLYKWRFWEKEYPFSHYVYRCHSCGAGWKSEEFPDMTAGIK